VTEKTSRHEDAWLAAICVAITATRWLTRAIAPDDPDSFGFILGMSQRYDLEALQPHFPGYPVYIALGRILCRLGVSGLGAATAISTVASGLGGFGLFVCARRLFGARGAFGSLALYAVAWLPWFLGGGAQSESLALALTLLAYAALLIPVPRPMLGGALAALVLGTRASYWPLIMTFVAVAFYELPSRRQRARLVFGLGFGVLAWAVPFVAMIGIRPLWDLGSAHVRGHFGWWGGSIATRPELLDRAGAFFRDWLFDGFAPSAWVLTAVAALTIAVLRGRSKATPQETGENLRRAATLIGVVFAPYALWVFLAQNVAEQPRHVLPLVVGSLLPLGAALARNFLALAAVVVLACVANGPLAVERHRTPPAAGQAAEWLELHAVPAETAIMADRSWRFFSALPGDFTVRKHAWLSEVVVDLARFERYPSAIWLTSEIDLHSGEGETAPIPSLWEITNGPTFCRDPRIDRAQPCLRLRTLRLNR
jgi:hypothetical protein